MQATVGERGQVTIPKELRDRMGIRPGQRLEFTEEDGRLVARKATSRERIAAVVGILSLPDTVDALVDEMRGRVELPPDR